VIGTPVLFCSELDKQLNTFFQFKATRDGTAPTAVTDDLKTQIFLGARFS
jgi:hypothetical protein